MILAAEGELHPIWPHTVEIIVGLIAFALLLWVLAKAGLPTLNKSYAAKTESIRTGLARAEEAEAEAEELKKSAQSRLDGVRDETARIRDDARAEAQQIKAELRTEAEEEAARIRAQADQQATAQREAAQRSLRGEIGGLSADLAERLLGAELADPARRSATVDGFLADLDGMGAR
ncbi:F0F1 ATP synthase subunit B [Pseudonocardia oroxyli]|jgi:F-type H+-transporting ATPase subunit b|uniref:ATP synthase subunit b n=1 Tax=Pseudonocardia oroxyli TaxID=366584 RepID=A0A1G7N7B2_PSEOR|nr:F0F1 ATP synthase subunit B [Pseudonocardia oroxyli]SDF69933.1 ATP synthase F0 subcomplex B subunit [Pseudonocardia oroxyli]